MQPYTEAQLQAYVESRLETDFQAWCGFPVSPAKYLGSQVRCASGVIDILGSLNNRPLIIELKAVPVTEKVVGQISRYKFAVRETFYGLCLDVCMLACDKGAIIDAETLRGEDDLTCVVIAPSYDANCLHSLRHTGWPLIAQMDDDGRFNIFRQENRRKHEWGLGSPQVYDLLKGAALEHVGSCVAKAWRDNWYDAENKKRDPVAYHVSEG